MISSKLSSSFSLFIVLGVILLGAWMWILEPAHSLRWAIGIAFLPVAWMGITFLQRFSACRRVIEGGHNALMGGIILGGVMLAGSYALKIAQHYTLIEDSSSDRLVAVLIGAFMVIIGNALPKKLEPLDATKCVQGKEQKFKRFAGWMFIISGFGYALAWLVLPESLADKLALPILAAPILIVMFRFFFQSLGKSQD